MTIQDEYVAQRKQREAAPVPPDAVVWVGGVVGRGAGGGIGGGKRMQFA